MKIGILTFHSALNYGAVLQAYASVHFLQSSGHEVYVVDYRNSHVSNIYHPLYWEKRRYETDGIKYLFKYPLIVCIKTWKSLVFRRFVHRRLPLCSMAEAEGMDLLLVGSDQLWNKRLTGGEDAVYEGRMFPHVRKAAWAVSAGDSMPGIEEIQRLTDHFEAISVREQCLAERIPQSTLLPDPTLLLRADQWKRLIHPVKGKYLLAYPLAYEDEVMETARRKAGELGCDLKVVYPYIKLGSTWMQTASPEDFLSLVYAAEYVVTSSFHGAVFSLVFDRPHTFIHHGDPRFETLQSVHPAEASARAKQFLDGIIPPPSSGGESFSKAAW